MSSRVLTPDVVGIDALVHDHQTVLAKAEGGVVAVFANNAPAFYAVTPARLAELLALEEKLARPGSDVALDYWQAEGKVFHHVQWQQKLARSLQIGRASNGGLPKRDVNTVSEPDSQIPPGFRG